MVSRQRAWQLRQIAAGKCQLCHRKLVTKNHCAMHRATLNHNNWLRYRRRKAQDKAIDKAGGL